MHLAWAGSRACTVVPGKQFIQGMLVKKNDGYHKEFTCKFAQFSNRRWRHKKKESICATHFGNL